MQQVPIVSRGFNRQSFRRQPISNIKQTQGIGLNSKDEPQKTESRTLPTTSNANQDHLYSRPLSRDTKSPNDSIQSKGSVKLSDSYSNNALYESIQRERKAHTMAPLARISGPSSSIKSSMFANIAAPSDTQTVKTSMLTQVKPTTMEMNNNDKAINHQYVEENAGLDNYNNYNYDDDDDDDNDVDGDDDEGPIIVTVRYDPESGGPPPEDAIREVVNNKLKGKSDKNTAHDPIILDFINSAGRSRMLQQPTRPEHLYYSHPNLNVSPPMNHAHLRIPVPAQQQTYQQSLQLLQRQQQQRQFELENQQQQQQQYEWPLYNARPQQLQNQRQRQRQLQLERQQEGNPQSHRQTEWTSKQQQQQQRDRQRQLLFQEQQRQFKMDQQRQFEMEQQRQFELEKQRQFEMEQQKRQFELEQQRQFEMDQQRQFEMEQQKRQFELEQQRQFEMEQQRQFEMEQQRQFELEKQRQFEMDQQRQFEMEQQRQFELEKQRQFEMDQQRQFELEKQEQLTREHEWKLQLQRQKQQQLEQEQLQRQRQEQLRRLKQDLLFKQQKEKQQLQQFLEQQKQRKQQQQLFQADEQQIRQENYRFLLQQHKQQELYQQEQEQQQQQKQFYQQKQIHPSLPPMGPRPSRLISSVRLNFPYRSSSLLSHNHDINPIQPIPIMSLPLRKSEQISNIGKPPLFSYRNTSATEPNSPIQTGASTLNNYAPKYIPSLFIPINLDMNTEQKQIPVNRPISHNVRSQLLERPHTAPGSTEMFRPPSALDLPELSKETLKNMLNDIPGLRGRRFNFEYTEPNERDGYPVPLPNDDDATNKYPVPSIVDQLPGNIIQHVKSSDNLALKATLGSVFQLETDSQRTYQSQPTISVSSGQSSKLLRHSARHKQRVQKSVSQTSDSSDNSREPYSSDEEETSLDD